MTKKQKAIKVVAILGFFIALSFCVCLWGSADHMPKWQGALVLVGSVVSFWGLVFSCSMFDPPKPFIE